MERLRRAPALDAVGDVLGERRAVLEAVTGAAADEPPRGCSGCRATRKCVSGDRSYWQTRAPITGASASAGSASPRSRALPAAVSGARSGRACRGRRARPGSRERSSTRARRRRRARRSPVVVEAAGRSRPRCVARRGRRRRGATTTGRAGEEARQPGAARPDDDVGVRRVGRVGASRLARHAAALSVLDQELRRAARVQHAGVRLEEHAVQVVERRARGRARRASSGVSHSCGDPEPLERRDAASPRSVGPAREPGDADRLADPRPRLLLQLEPERACAPGELACTTPPRRARSAEARVAARAGADVPGEYCSTSVTCQPRIASSRAIEAPKTPAPTTTAVSSLARRDGQREHVRAMVVPGRVEPLPRLPRGRPARGRRRGCPPRPTSGPAR